MINNISFLNFKSNLKKVDLKANKNNFIQAPKLAPLTQDTVNFTGNINEWKVAIDNSEVCSVVSQDAKPANEYLRSVLEKHFAKDIYDEDSNPKGKIEPIRTRVKSADSLEEKISAKIRTVLSSKDKDISKRIFSPQSPEAIKNNVKDISGGRIVVREAFGDAMDIVVDNLCKMIEEENLFVDEIENHTSPDPKALPYFTEDQLKKINESVNWVRKSNGYEGIKVKSSPSRTGYMALHLSIDTRFVVNNRKNHGYWSELQIIGSDVELLKDIEDFCYKLKKEMGVVSHDAAYSPFEEFFVNAYNDVENYPEVKKAFDEYTIKAYQCQRNRRPSADVEDNTSDWAYKYPTIKECGLEGKIPPILDFNILARIKRDCDDLYYVKNHIEPILENINNLPKVAE